MIKPSENTRAKVGKILVIQAPCEGEMQSEPNDVEMLHYFRDRYNKWEISTFFGGYVKKGFWY